MRFNKGTKVEVLSKSSVPSGAWRSAEIISGNGHYYTVMYDHNDGTERVPRKSMRPEPPRLQVLDAWCPGDILEVFQSCSWKMAIVSKVLGNGCFLVRLLGSSLKFKVTKSDIRVRQSWQDNEWIMIGQVLVSFLCDYIFLKSVFELTFCLFYHLAEGYIKIKRTDFNRRTKEKGESERQLHFI